MKKNNRDPSFIRKMRVHTSVVQLHCDSRPGLAVMYEHEGSEHGPMA